MNARCKRTFAELSLGGFSASSSFTTLPRQAATPIFCLFPRENGAQGGDIVSRRNCVRDVHDKFPPKCRNAELHGIDQTLLGMHQKTWETPHTSTSRGKHTILRTLLKLSVPHLLDFSEANLSSRTPDKARRDQGRTDWTGVQTQYSEKWSLFWSVAALKTVVYPFHFISFLTHQLPFFTRSLS